jgi:hypothetical protein
LKKNVDDLKDKGFGNSLLGIAGDIIYLNSKSN